MLWKKVLLPLVFATVALPSHAQSWSVGAGTGPFIFGRFVDRNLNLGTELGSAKNTLTVSAAPRPGVVLGVERDLNGWLALRLDGSFTHSKLRVRGRGASNGVNLDAGTINVTTLALPLAINFNRHGAFRFSIFGGPARALYDIHRRAASGQNETFAGSRRRWGGEGGADVDWWLGPRFAIEGEISDTITSSPFKRSDYAPNTVGVQIPKPQNVHTTVGIRYRF
jgi:hypothetical protein